MNLLPSNLCSWVRLLYNLADIWAQNIPFAVPSFKTDDGVFTRGLRSYLQFSTFVGS